MKDNYEEPKIDIYVLSTEDVIATSGGGGIDVAETDDDNSWGGLVPVDRS